MGVFGGIIVGLGVAALHNRFYRIELPQVLSFFGGTRFVPIISALVYTVVGIAMYYIWPVVQSGIYSIGDLVLSSGYAGTWIYGVLERGTARPLGCITYFICLSGRPEWAEPWRLLEK